MKCECECSEDRRLVEMMQHLIAPPTNPELSLQPNKSQTIVNYVREYVGFLAKGRGTKLYLANIVFLETGLLAPQLESSRARITKTSTRCSRTGGRSTDA